MSTVLYFNSVSSLVRAASSLPLSNIELLIIDTLTTYMGLQRYTVVAVVTDTPCHQLKVYVVPEILSNTFWWCVAIIN